MKRSEAPIVVEQNFNSPIEKVWSAITEPEQMVQWFFPLIESFKAEVGFETKFLVEHEGRKFTHCWKVVDVVAPHRIKYGWRYVEYDGDSFVTFELIEEDEGTKLILSTEVIADFPDDVPEFQRDSCEGGWEYFLCGNLKEYLS